MEASKLISLIVLIAHWSIIAGLTVRVIKQRRSVGVSLAWMAVIYSVPFAGAALYLLIGERRYSPRRVATHRKIEKTYQRWQATLRGGVDVVALDPRDPCAALYRHAQTTLGFPPLAGNTLQLLDDHASMFAAIKGDIDASTRHCHLEFYIWQAGGEADEIVNALLRARKRGVAVRLLLDAHGSKPFLQGAPCKRLREAGAEVVAALPVLFIHAMVTRADMRNHRKIVVIDDRVAYIGSQNLADPRYFRQDAGVGQWVDAMARVQGPAVEALAGTFLYDWALDTGGDFQLPQRHNVAPGPAQLRSTVQVVPSNPGYRPEALHQLLLTAIYGARERLLISTPYFVPDEAIVTALVSAAHRGVAVTLVVPEKNDSRLVRYASAAYFDALIAAGVTIAHYQDGLLHTKSITVDDAVSIFGSVNLDMRSLWLNLEVSLIVHDPVFTNDLRAVQNRYLAQSRRLDPGQWNQRPATQRLKEDAARLMGPLL